MFTIGTFGGLLLLLFSIVCFAFWVLLYVDDDNTVQNRLTVLWAWAESVCKKARSKEENFLRRIVKITAHGFEYLLGKQLISVRAVSVSLCFSLSSVGVSIIALSSVSALYQQFILPSLAWSVSFSLLAASRRQRLRNVVSGGIVLFALFAGFAVLVAPESSLLLLTQPNIGTKVVRVLTEVSVEDVTRFRTVSDAELIDGGFSSDEVSHLRAMTDAELMSLFRLDENEREHLAKAIEEPLARALVDLPDYRPVGIQGRTVMASILGLALLLATMSDLVVIFLTRKFLRLSDSSQSVAKLVGFALPNLMIVIVFFVVPFVLGFCMHLPLRFEMCFALLAAMNWSVVFVSLSWIFLGIALVVNRIFWPSLAGYLDKRSTEEIGALRHHCRWLWVLTLGIAAELLGLKWLTSWF